MLGFFFGMLIASLIGKACLQAQKRSAEQWSI